MVNSTNSKLALYSLDKNYIYVNNLEPVNRIEIREIDIEIRAYVLTKLCKFIYLFFIIIYFN